MAGGMKTSGTEELANMLGKLGKEAGNIASKALYKGAGVVADAYSSAVSNISTEEFHYVAVPSIVGKRKPSPEEKAALAGATGIAKFHKNGSEVDTIVGEPEGYATIRGRRVALKMIARSINSGTSFMEKQPVFRRAASSSRGAAQQAMEAEAEKLIREITKN